MKIPMRAIVLLYARTDVGNMRLSFLGLESAFCRRAFEFCETIVMAGVRAGVRVLCVRFIQ